MIFNPTQTNLCNNNSSDESCVSVGSVVSTAQTAELSFVIPVMNEEETLEELVNGILQHVEDYSRIEVIFIDDGSSDRSWDVIQSLADTLPTVVRGIRFRSNRGKAVALQAGFDVAVGDIIFTMDADLQDDPKEIPRFLAKIDEGYDLVSGWKAVRHDPWHKVLPSRIFNRMLSGMSKVNLHDHNCGFKCYRREVAKSIQLFGELHRMVPSLAGMQGYRVSEIVVEHHARKFGKSKYGIERFIRGFSDMLTVGFLRVYRERPSHFANFFAVGYVASAAILAVVGLVLGVTAMAGLLCLLTAICLVGMGGTCMLGGLLSELMIRQQHDTPSAVITDTFTSKQVNQLDRKVIDPAGSEAPAELLAA